jgi:hypothetical protein
MRAYLQQSAHLLKVLCSGEEGYENLFCSAGKFPEEFVEESGQVRSQLSIYF